MGKKSKSTYFNFPIGQTDQLFQAKLFEENKMEHAAISGKIALESQINDVAPSVFTNHPSSEVTEKYTFI